MKLPKRIPKRATQRQVTVWVEKKDIDRLMKNGVNVSEFVREQVAKAAASIYGGYDD